MRIYISVDMEGIAGVVHEDQTNPVDPRCAGEYGRFRHLMTAEANAAIAGAFEGGAITVLVNDSHWEMRNLLAEELDPRAELVSGGPKLRSMMEGIEGGADGVFCVGYHAKAGTRNAILDHTYTDRLLDVRLNGRSVGELGINAAVAGAYGAPVLLVTGDTALAAEARDLLGAPFAAVTVKEAVGRHAARSIAPSEACRRIQLAAREVVQKQGRGEPRVLPFVVPPPITLEIDFSKTVEADMAEVTPGSVRTTGRTVSYTHEDYREVFRAFRAMQNLASVG